MAGSEEVARQLTLTRLYYVYFGLTFLGFGSALFALFCPLIVKNYASAIDCVQAESAFVTRSRIALIVSTVSYHYVNWLGAEPDQPHTIMKRMGEPLEFTNLCSVAMVEVFSDLPPGLFEKEPAPAVDLSDTGSPNQTAPSYEEDPFYDRRGRPDSYMIAKALTSGRRRMQWFVRAFQKQAGTEPHRNDMLALHYMALDNTRASLRMFVALFYGLGFSLLLIPTIITFVQLAWQVVL